MTEVSRAVAAVIRGIPEGNVCAYGMVAAMAGVPGGARLVARLLHSASGTQGLPWWRVVRSDGSIALHPGYGFEEQVARLRAEGVVVGDGGKVPRQFMWCGAD